MWTICIVAAFLYARQRGIPNEVALILLPAFLIEAKFYLILGTEGLRMRVSRMLPRGGLAVALVVSAIIPYLAATLATGAFSWPPFFILAGLMTVAAFWYVLLPHIGVVDVAFLVIVAAVILSKVFREIYPDPHPRLPLEILGQLAWIRVGAFALLELRGVKVGFGFVPSRRDWLVGLRYYLFFLPLGAAIALGLDFAKFRPLDFVWWKTSLIALGTFLGILWVVALSEEFVFRGLLQTWIGQWTRSEWLGLGIAAVLFGAVHLSYRDFPNWRFATLAAVAGVFYGLAFRDAKSIRASMVTHALVVTTWRVFFS